MKTIDVNDAAALGEAAKALRPGEMLTLTRDGAPVAAVVGLAAGDARAPAGELGRPSIVIRNNLSIGDAPAPARDPRPIDALGLREGQFHVPEDFDSLYEDEIRKMFGLT